MPQRDATWEDSLAYACPCGCVYAVTYWRWIDARAQPEREAKACAAGPLEGDCPRCGTPAAGHATWLRIRTDAQEAELIIPSSRRAFVVDELRAHLDNLSRRPGDIGGPWLLSPAISFQQPGQRPVASIAQGQASAEPTPPKRAAGKQQTAPADPASDMTAGVPQVISNDPRTPRPPPPNLGAIVCELTREGGVPTVQAAVPAAQVEEWIGAKLETRPILLRNFGYPLLGVRIVASYMGQRGCIDAVVDVASDAGAEIFDALAQRFELRVHLSGPETPSLAREVVGAGLEPNAALCLDAARRALAKVREHAGGYRKARAALATLDVETRLSPPPVTLAPGEYQHLITANEAWRALEHLERAAERDHLVRLLEVEGLPLEEYEAVRRRVLQGALEFGLAAPRRFWRRVIALGLAQDLQDYVDRLAQQRAKHEGQRDDLTSERNQAAWRNIASLCEIKGLVLPTLAARALALQESTIVRVDPSDGETESLKSRLREPGRLRLATELLRGGSDRGIGLVIDGLAGFTDDEVLGLLPDLVELGRRAVPSLLPLLGSPRPVLRQIAAILLGMSSEPEALDPLCERLLVEDGGLWVDVAQAIAAYDVAAVDALEEVFEAQPVGARRGRAIERGGRVLAEVIIQGGDLPAYETRPDGGLLHRLAQENGLMAAAARHALATLPQVRRSSAARRGELPVVSPTEDERFARRAYEAILVPELDVEAEA